MLPGCSQHATGTIWFTRGPVGFSPPFPSPPLRLKHQSCRSLIGPRRAPEQKAILSTVFWIVRQHKAWNETVSLSMLATRSANCWDPPETFCHLLNFPWCCVGALTSQRGFSKDSSSADYFCFDAKETRSRVLEMQKNGTSQRYRQACGLFLWFAFFIV